MEYGLQLYSVRDITQKGLQSAMQKVADLGYGFVEFAGFFGNAAPEVGRMLRETGLRVSGTHTGWEELTPNRIADTILYHKIIGNKNIIIPWADLSDRLKLSQARSVCCPCQRGATSACTTRHYTLLPQPQG